MGEGAEGCGEGLSLLKLNPADFADMKEKKARVACSKFTCLKAGVLGYLLAHQKNRQTMCSIIGIR